SSSRMQPSCVLQLAEPPQPGDGVGVGFGVEHGTRDDFIDPWRAVGLSGGVGGSLTLLENGKQLGQVTASAEALRLFELLPGHVLGVDVTSVATFGQLELRSQLTGAGGLSGLRGYLPSD